MGSWPEEREQRLRRMEAAGCSIAEIALALGVTQRAVIGKRNRLGLTRGKGDAYATAIRRAERAKIKETV